MRQTYTAPEDAPPFRADARCGKCDGDDVSTRYCLGWTDSLRGWPCHNSGWADHEHLDRCCRRCGYKWLERCV